MSRVAGAEALALVLRLIVHGLPRIVSHVHDPVGQPGQRLGDARPRRQLRRPQPLLLKHRLGLLHGKLGTPVWKIYSESWVLPVPGKGPSGSDGTLPLGTNDGQREVMEDGGAGLVEQPDIDLGVVIR